MRRTTPLLCGSRGLARLRRASPCCRIDSERGGLGELNSRRPSLTLRVKRIFAADSDGYRGPLCEGDSVEPFVKGVVVEPLVDRLAKRLATSKNFQEPGATSRRRLVRRGLSAAVGAAGASVAGFYWDPRST